DFARAVGLRPLYFPSARGVISFPSRDAERARERAPRASPASGASGARFSSAKRSIRSNVSFEDAFRNFFLAATPKRAPGGLQRCGPNPCVGTFARADSTTQNRPQRVFAPYRQPARQITLSNALGEVWGGVLPAGAGHHPGEEGVSSQRWAEQVMQRRHRTSSPPVAAKNIEMSPDSRARIAPCALSRFAQRSRWTPGYLEGVAGCLAGTSLFQFAAIFRVIHPPMATTLVGPTHATAAVNTNLSTAPARHGA